MSTTTLKPVMPAESYSALAEAISAVEIAAVLMIDHLGQVVFWNRGAESLFGRTSEEVLGRNLHQFLAPERFREAHLEAFAHFLKAGEGAAVGKTVELAGLRRDGTEIPIALSLCATRMKDGWGAVGIIQDISDRQQLEHELILERLQLFSIFDGMVDAVYVVDPETSEGGVSVRMGLEEQVDKQVFLRFTVNDSGIGIGTEKLEEIFNAFSQADSSFSRQYGGLGLGLALAQRMVETMGGRIGGESD